VNYKAIDTIGHLFSADGVEMSDAVSYQDEALRELVSFLNRVVGKGRWVMALTADHGTQRDPAVSGAFMIDVNKIDSLVRKAFDNDDDGVPLVEKVRATEIWLNTQELANNGFTLDDVSQFIVRMTQQETFKNRNTPVPGHANDAVFSAAFPSSMLSRLPCLPEARAS
jgi:predicted AlkP superfamily pyrophosphatase or phosphodiesterase